MQASQAFTKAQSASTVAECDYALDDIRSTIANFELSSGGHLAYLNKLYEEQHAYVQRRRELTRKPTPEMKIEMLVNTLRMINFRAVEALREGAPVVLCHDIMRLSREAIYNLEK
jgi:DNA-binding transcriptional regulator YbjK